MLLHRNIVMGGRSIIGNGDVMLVCGDDYNTFSGSQGASNASAQPLPPWHHRSEEIGYVASDSHRTLSRIAIIFHVCFNN